MSSPTSVAVASGRVRPLQPSRIPLRAASAGARAETRPPTLRWRAWSDDAPRSSGRRFESTSRIEPRPGRPRVGERLDAARSSLQRRRHALSTERNNPAVERENLVGRLEAPACGRETARLGADQDGGVLVGRGGEHVLVRDVVTDDEEPALRAQHALDPRHGVGLAGDAWSDLEHLGARQLLVIRVGGEPQVDGCARLDEQAHLLVIGHGPVMQRQGPRLSLEQRPRVLAPEHLQVRGERIDGLGIDRQHRLPPGRTAPPASVLGDEEHRAR